MLDGRDRARFVGDRRDDDRVLGADTTPELAEEIEQLEQRRLPRGREHDDSARLRRADRVERLPVGSERAAAAGLDAGVEL